MMAAALPPSRRLANAAVEGSVSLAKSCNASGASASSSSKLSNAPRRTPARWSSNIALRASAGAVSRNAPHAV